MREREETAHSGKKDKETALRAYAYLGVPPPTLLLPLRGLGLRLRLYFVTFTDLISYDMI